MHLDFKYKNFRYKTNSFFQRIYTKNTSTATLTFLIYWITSTDTIERVESLQETRMSPFKQL